MATTYRIEYISTFHFDVLNAVSDLDVYRLINGRMDVQKQLNDGGSN